MEISSPVTNSHFSFWKKVIFISLFFLITPIALGTSLLSLITLMPTKAAGIAKDSIPITDYQAHSGVQVYASLPSELPAISGQVLGIDARPEIVQQYLDKYDSPMKSQSKVFVDMADKYDLDYRLLVAIARKESGLGKRIPASDCLNPFGWGVHTKGTLCFDTWEEGIETVARGLKEKYMSKGLKTPSEIMTLWVPHSPEGIWAEDVSFYMNQMQ